MKHASLTAITFTAISALQFAFRPGAWAALMFITSICAYVFILWLTQWRDGELERLERQIQEIKNKVDGLSIAKGFSR